MAKKIRFEQDAVIARERLYPPAGDALDAIMKALQFLDGRGGVNLPADTKAWIAACLDVKTKVPKKTGAS